ncbi:MAG: aromatic ring-hydroxylating oxygenase subunit alpha [Alphaproteobacteria bacterium]
MTAEPNLPDRATDRFHPDPARSYTLPSRYYHDPAVFEREREAVWARSWLLVGHGEKVREPGDYLTAELADERVIVIRGRDGTLRAFYNVCQHRAHQLLEGSGHASVITCPYHGWSYQSDGRLRSARECEKVDGFEPGAFSLKPVRVELFCGFMFVNLDAAAPSLASLAPELEAEVRQYVKNLDRLTHAHRLTFEVTANWKTIIDNYLECYHCPVSHKGLSGMLDLDDYRIDTYRIHSSQVSGTKRNSAAAYDTTGAEVTAHCSWWLWPNLCWLQFPGRGGMMVYSHVPEAPERTLQVVDFYFPDKTPTAREWEQIKFLETTLRPEDKRLCESVQRGLRSRGYHQGRFMVDRARRAGWSEHGVHHFQTLVRRALGV